MTAETLVNRPLTPPIGSDTYLAEAQRISRIATRKFGEAPGAEAGGDSAFSVSLLRENAWK